MLAQIVWKEAEKWRRDLEAAGKKMVADARIALRVEGYRLRTKLRMEIARGLAGGKKFPGLSMIRGWNARTRKMKSPLARLARTVRYWEDIVGKDYMVSVGWQEKAPMAFGRRKSYRPLAASWVALIRRHQEGFSRDVSPAFRKMMIKKGAKLKKQGYGRAARYFFLKPTTTRLQVPARPVIEPFWQANHWQAAANIQRNFEAKQKGARI